jgi:peroxiredoxin
VSFFSGDCAACKPTLSSLQDLSSSYSEVTFIGVSEDVDAVDARTVATQQSLTFPIVHDEDRRLAKSFRVGEPPKTFVAGTDGRVRWVGTASHGKADLERAIAAIAP